MKIAIIGAFLLLAPNAHAIEVDDNAALKISAPKERIVDTGIDQTNLAKITRPVDAFYGFWNNGSTKLLEAALSNDFVDHTLPPGRPQGPSGPAAASTAFLSAVPDLKAEVEQQLIVGDRVVSHLHFTGHFTGAFMGRSGKGETVDFIATDILKVAEGKITDNWHIEDNLTFLQEIGVFNPEASSKVNK